MPRLGALLALPAMAQGDALKDYPGYVDFGELSTLFGEPTVQIAVWREVAAPAAKAQPERGTRPDDHRLSQRSTVGPDVSECRCAVPGEP